MLFRSLSRSGLYPFPSFNKSSSPTALLGVKTTTISYQRLGHPALPILQKLAKSIELHGTASSHFCVPCQLGKSSRLPFVASKSSSTRPLELIHSDVWGPTPIMSVIDFKFYVLFVDDFTRYTWLFPIQCKSEVFSVFLSFKLQVENMLSLKTQCFRSDGGGELITNLRSCLMTVISYISLPVLTHRSRMDVQNASIGMLWKLVLLFC